MTLNTRKKDTFAFWMMLALLAFGYGLLSLLMAVVAGYGASAAFRLLKR